LLAYSALSQLNPIINFASKSITYMLKKIVIALVAIIVLIIGAAVVLPIIFKDNIIKLAQDEANKNLNATIAFEDIDISLFTHFPDFTLSITEVSVTGKDQFDGVKLADIGAIQISLDLMSVIGGEHIKVNAFGLVKPDMHVIVLEDGTANYDIAKPSEETETEEETSGESADFSASVSEYFIRNAHIIYDDRQGNMYAELVDFTHEGSGDFTQDNFLLKTNTSSEEITYKMDGMSYLSRTNFEMKFDINVDMPNMKFTFDENSVRLNALELNFDGWVAMPDEPEAPIDMDMTFGTAQTDFKSILSLVPAVFMTDFNDIETAGSLALSGMAKGRMVGDLLPAFDVNLKVADAMFHYPDLPKSAENIAIDLRAQNKGGSDDNTIIDINTFHVELAKNPIDLTLHMRTPISDPFIDATVKSDFDLGTIKDVIPLEEGQSLTGKVFSDLRMKGNQSAIDQERYQDFEASGTLALTDFNYVDPTLPYATLIKKCSLAFSPQYAELSQLDMLIGKSDMSLVGRMDNIVAWYVANEPLSGTFNFSSNFLDVNEFMEEETAEGEEVAEEESTGVVEIPAGFDFVLNTNIKKLLYDGIDITNITGSVILRDQAINMKGLSMNLMDGSMVMGGKYSTKNPAKPLFDFDMNISQWDVVTTFEKMDIVKESAPVLESATGRFSTKMKMAGAMDQNMDPIYNTLTGGGKLTTHNVKIQNPESLAKVAKAVKYDKLKDVTLDNVNVSFYFEDGRIKVDPTQFVIGKEIPSIFSGSHGFDKTLDYVLNLDIPTASLGGAANQLMSGLMSQANKVAGTNAAVPDRLKVDVDIEGIVGDAKITPRFAGSEKSAGDQAKDKVMDEVNKKKDELENQARAEADKAKAQAQAEADRLKNEAMDAKAKAEADAKAKANAAKAKAEAEAKKKADEAKKKAEAEAKKKLKGLLGK
jgi:hypothetical protein